MPETCILSFRNSSLFIFIFSSSIPVVADESKFTNPIPDELCNWVQCNDCEKNRRLPVELEDTESDWYVLPTQKWEHTPNSALGTFRVALSTHTLVVSCF